MDQIGGLGFWMGVLGVLGFVHGLLPSEYQRVYHQWVRRVLHFIFPDSMFDIPEFVGGAENEIYDEVQMYLTKVTSMKAQHVNLCRPKNATKTTFTLAHNETLEDTFMGARIWWTHILEDRKQQAIFSYSDGPQDQKRMFSLKLRKGDKDRVLEPYMQHVKKVAETVKERSRDRLLYTNHKNYSHRYEKRLWDCIPFKHPSTFDTLAMEPELKEEIKKDLREFTKGKDFYERAGKAWKRGYLLYGPPGTGKSSMIAAIANFLEYDLYDLELTEVKSNSELRKLLIQTTNRSVIVIEDIDCSADLPERAKDVKTKAAEELVPSKPADKEASQLTLSGLLNFTDGLWSSCGSERLIIFTTNFIEKLDPALLRAGRMDKHILMSWCTFAAFRTLAKNILGLEWHDLYPSIDKAFTDKEISPADVSEILLQKKDDPTSALEGLLKILHNAKLATEVPIVKLKFDGDQANIQQLSKEATNLQESVTIDDPERKLIDME